MEIADAGMQVSSLNVTGSAVGIQKFGWVKEDVELLCLTSIILGMRYDIFSKRLFLLKHQKRELRSDAGSAAKYAICKVNHLRRKASSKADVRFFCTQRESQSIEINCWECHLTLSVPVKIQIK